MKNKKFKLLNIAFIAVLLYSLSSCLNVDEPEYTKEKEKKDLETLIAKLKEKKDVKVTPSGMYYIVFEKGDAASSHYAQLGDSLQVRFNGFLVDGSLFSTSRNINDPTDDDSYNFVLKEDDMIKGWVEAMQMMKKGSKMRFIMPSELAYGSKGTSSIPPYQTLVFDVEMLKIIIKEQE